MRNGAEAEDRARKILELRKDGKTYQMIAEELNVSISTVYNVVKARTWGCLQNPPSTPVPQ